MDVSYGVTYINPDFSQHQSSINITYTAVAAAEWLALRTTIWKARDIEN